MIYGGQADEGMCAMNDGAGTRQLSTKKVNPCTVSEKYTHAPTARPPFYFQPTS